MAPKKKVSPPVKKKKPAADDATVTPTAEESTAAALGRVRAEVTSLLGKGTITEEDRKTAQSLMDIWCAASGLMDDAAFMCLQKVYGAKPPSKTVKVQKTRIDFTYLEQFMVDTFLAYGVPEDEAKIAANVLIVADKRGIDSHGIGRLKPIYCDRIDAGILKPTAPLEIIKETETTAVVDGNLGLGLVIGPKCMEMAIAKARKYGLGMVVCRNSTHYGAACYYPLMAEQAGMIGVTGTNARPSIAPTFGVDAMLGTNPMTWGMPSDDPFPFCLDCATSINQRGKIEKYEREGQPTPAGQVGDRDGRERTDTTQILKDLVSGQAFLAPLGGVGDEMGGYKGYGYATVVELLSSALQDGAYSTDCRGTDLSTGQKIPMPLGHWFIAINVESFLPLDRFKSKVGTFLRQMRDSAKDPKGPGRIFTAGELEHEAEVERSANGGAPVPEALLKDMRDLRAKLPPLQEKYAQFAFEESPAAAEAAAAPRRRRRQQRQQQRRWRSPPNGTVS